MPIMVVEEWTAAMVEPAHSESPIELTLVVADRCALCSHAREVLAAIGHDLPLRVAEVNLESDQGQALAERVPLVFPPVLLRDGAVMSYGRLSERRLRKELADA